jgi:hypothetical protein
MSLQNEKCVSLEQLIGTWLVRRKIVDYLAHTAHLFEGLAILTHDRFEERGELKLNGLTFRSCRTYKLAWSASSVAVLFPNDAVFIQLARANSQVVRHVCGSDDYRGRLLFRNAFSWVESWRVCGPRKNYSSRSHYRRFDSAPRSDSV